MNISNKAQSKERNNKRNIFPSNIEGNYIVNAVTGAKYPWKVGSLDDQRFFKVTDTANNVNFYSVDYGKRVYNKLFYESPYEYMNHRNIKLDKETINNWLIRLNKHFPDNPYRLNKLSEESEKSEKSEESEESEESE